MDLTLRIENFDFLADGGPLEFTASGRGFEVGRGSAMDWTLPDPGRHISTRHFEVAFQGGAYWLTDVSTNGTYLSGQATRLPGPHQLADGDRLQVGQYIIAVSLGAGVSPAAGGAFAPSDAGQYGGGAALSTPQAPSPAPAPAANPSDPWAIDAPAPPPMDPRDFAPPPRERAPDFADEFISGSSFGTSATPAPEPTPTPTPAPASPASAPEAPAPDAASPFPASGGEGFGAPVSPQPAPPAPAATPQAMPSAGGFGPADTPAPAVAPAPAAAGASAAADGAILDAICEGAGLPPGALSSVDTRQFGLEVGRALRISTSELTALLGARAATKQFVKSSSRTMIGASDNSPLKFLPDATQALDAMFVNKRQGYLDGVGAFREGFDDVKRHQAAIYAAIQPALAQLLEDIAPESIEDRAGGGGGFGASKKARFWDTFVERWDAKTHRHDNGMLDVFLAYFAEAYDEAVKKTGKN